MKVDIWQEDGWATDQRQIKPSGKLTKRSTDQWLIISYNSDMRMINTISVYHKNDKIIYTDRDTTQKAYVTKEI